MGCSNGGSWESPVGDAVPDVGQALNDSGHSIPVVCSKQPRHVFEEQDGSCVHAPINEAADVVEEPSLIVYSFALSSERERLAWEPGGQ